jgi:SpoVG
MVRGIKVIKGRTGLYISFPSKKQRNGSHRHLAFPANAETPWNVSVARDNRSSFAIGPDAVSLPHIAHPGQTPESRNSALRSV